MGEQEVISKKEIYAAHLKRSAGHNPWDHTHNSVSLLSRISRRLDKAEIVHGLSIRHPFNLIVYTRKGRVLSVHSHGFTNNISILPLKRNGRPFHSKYEVSFVTPDGVVNFIVRRYG